MQLAERLEEELSMIEFEVGRLLDDESLKLIAQLRAHNILTQEDWTPIKSFVRTALEFLIHHPQPPEQGGHAVLDDTDPRNADWIKIAGVGRRTGFVLPDWAALWIWWLHTDEPTGFWHRVGRIAKEMGFPPSPLAAHDRPKPALSMIALHKLREGEPPLGRISPSEEHWLRNAFFYLRRIDYWRRKNESNAHCIFEIGPVYFQCFAPPHDRYLRCEAVSDKYVPEVASILTSEKRQKLNEFGFSAPGASKNFSRKIEIESQKDLAFVARLAFRVLRDVYSVGDFENARLKIGPAGA